MNLEAISIAAAISLVSTLAFLLIIKSWQALSGVIGGSRHFSGSIMVEAAQRFRDEVDRLSRRLQAYLASALVFVVVFAVSYALRPVELFGDQPTWRVSLILAALAISVLYAVYRIGGLWLARQRIAFQRDASLAAGHGLAKLTANRNRVFHDVPAGDGLIDNVIVGLHGVYAVNVVARRPGRDNRARLDGETLMFASGHRAVSLAEFGHRSRQLAREFQKLLKHEVRVRSVIAVPGWEIVSQSSDEHLVVNERNLAMLRGWKDQNDYLLNEDVEKLQALLTERCTRRQ